MFHFAEFSHSLHRAAPAAVLTGASADSGAAKGGVMLDEFNSAAGLHDPELWMPALKDMRSRRGRRPRLLRRLARPHEFSGSTVSFFPIQPTQ